MDVYVRAHGEIVIETTMVDEAVQFIHLGDPHLISDVCENEAVKEWACYRRDEVFEGPEKNFRNVVSRMPLGASDLIVCTGDLIDFYEESQVDYAMSVVKSLPCPFYVTPGNHDFQDVRGQGDQRRIIDPRENEDLQLEQKAAYWAKSLGHDFPNWHFCHKGINFIGLDNSAYEFHDAAIDLLRSLAAEDKPFLVFSHVPLALPTVAHRLGLIWGEQKSMPSDHANTQDFLRIIESSDNFLGSFVGHAHFRSDDQMGQSYQFITADTMSNDFREVIIRPPPGT